MTRHTTKLAAFAISYAITISAYAQTPEEIIEQSIEAMGGYDAVASIQSVSRRGRVELNAFDNLFIGTTEVVILPWRKAWQKSSVALGTTIQAWDGKVGWEDGRRGLRELGPSEVGGIRIAAVLHPFVGYQMLYTLGMTIERAEDEELNGADHFVLTVDFTDDISMKAYVDKETKLVSRMSFNIFSPELDMPIEITVDNLEHEDYGGIILPRTSKLAIGKLLSIKSEYRETVINEPVDESIFQMPSAAEEE